MNKVVLTYITTLLFPFIGLCTSLYNWTKRYSKNVFWIFCAFSGLVFIYKPDIHIGIGNDSERYADVLTFMHNNIHSFSAFKDTLYQGDSIDIYQPLITYLVSLYTDNAHWLFFIFALIYGYFYSRNIWFVLERLPVKFNRLYWILIAYFILLCPIWNINGVRMWTALQVFVYGALPYLMNNDRRKLIWCFICPFIHFSFVMPLIVLVVHRFLPLKKSMGAYFVFFVITIFFNTVDIAAIRNIVEQIPFLESRQSYLSDAYIEKVTETTYSAYVNVALFLQKWCSYILIFLTYIYYKSSRQIQTEEMSRVLSFTLLLYGVVNIISVMPTLGSRFLFLAQMFAFAAILFVITKLQTIQVTRLPYRKLFNCVTLLLAFPTLFYFRIGFDMYGIMIFFGNFFTAPFIISDIPLILFVKSIL